MRSPVRIIAHRNRSGNISLRLRCLLGSRYHDIATAITLHPSNWDARRQRILPSHPDAQNLNARLNSLVDSATLCIQRQPTATPDELRKALGDVAAAPEAPDDLYAALDEFIRTESRRNTWTDGTITRFRSLSASLFAFSPVLHLSTISPSTLDTYIDFRASQGRSNTTIAREIKLIKWFLRWCRHCGLYAGDLHDTYAPHLKGANYEYKEIIHLTLDELTAIETAELPPTLAAIRDVFIFCCFTGLRYSDAMKLKRADVHDSFIEVVTKKTGKRLRIELNRHSAAILDRYATPDDIGTTPALPQVTNQYGNRILKRIGQLCNIDEPISVVTFSGRQRKDVTLPKWKLLTTHCARRTFVVTALQLDIHIEVISRWTGHSDLKALKPYVAIVDELKARNMAKFNDI